MISKIFPNNENMVDRTLRIIVGLGVLSLVFIGPKSNWGFLGLIPLATGLIGSCPVYTILGMRTKKADE